MGTMMAASGVRNISTKGEFDDFVERLLSAERPPLVVASIAEGATEPAIPLDVLVEELAGAAAVYVLHPHATFWLTDRLGKHLSVFWGWVRVYPARPTWRQHMYDAPLLSPRAHRKRWVDAVVDAVLDAAFADGYRPSESSAPGAGVAASAVVDGVISATQAFVRFDDGKQGVMRTHQLWPGIPAERLVRKAQRFEGKRVAGGLLDDFVPSRPADDVHARVVAYVGDGIVTSAKVASVSGGRAELLLHPEAAVTIEEEGLAGLLAADEVVTVLVVPAEDGGFEVTFSSDDPEPSLPVLPGGPPWLEPVATLAPAPEAAEAGPDVDEGEADGGGAEPAELDEATFHGEQVERLERQLERERSKAQQLRRDLRHARSRLREQKTHTLPVVFDDPIEQLRLELWMAYLTRVPPSDRGRYPWPDRFVVGEGFVDSVDKQVRSGGISRDKVLDVCAEVLCGLAKDLPARAVKEWAESKQGSAESRADGAVAMRVRVQVDSPSARRIKYWRLPDGTIELDSVRLHDDGLSQK